MFSKKIEAGTTFPGVSALAEIAEFTYIVDRNLDSKDSVQINFMTVS